jgi:hypothetical protein
MIWRVQDATMKKQLRVIYFGYSVLAAIFLISVSMAFLRGGHPPGSGIVNLLIIVFAYPLSVYGSIIGLKTSVNSLSVSPKVYFTMVGACVAFAMFSTLLLIFKFIFGKSI